MPELPTRNMPLPEPLPVMEEPMKEIRKRIHTISLFCAHKPICMLLIIRPLAQTRELLIMILFRTKRCQIALSNII